MANRCPDCSKFVGLGTPEPEEESFDFDVHEDGVTITATLQQNRECAECGTLMKSTCHELEEEFTWEQIGIILGELSEEDHADFCKLWDVNGSSTFLVDVESDGTEVEEGGGGRYAKNVITSSINATITVNRKNSAYEITHEVTLKGSAAASEFEDEC